MQKITFEKAVQMYRNAPKTEEPECTHDGSECRLLACNVGCKYMENDSDGFVCNRHCRWITPADKDGNWLTGQGLVVF